MALSRITPTLSVRMRLIVLALIPVFGFAAIGLAYMSSETDRGGSLRQRAAVRAPGRCEPRLQGSAHRHADERAKDFVAQPQPGIAQRFAEAHQAAIDSLKTIQELAGEAERQSLSALSGRVANLKTTFAAL